MRSCHRSALHLELRDGYMRGDPMFIAWQNGERYDQSDRASWWNPWLELVSDTVGRGVQVRRARVVSEPVSEYIRFEYDVTFRNVAVGEQVRWLSRQAAVGLQLPVNDFWLFDGELALVNYFSGEGDKAGAELIRDPELVTAWADVFEAVWELATPHEQYRPT